MKDLNDSGDHQKLAQHYRTLAGHEPNALLRALYVGLAEKHAALAEHLFASSRL